MAGAELPERLPESARGAPAVAVKLTGPQRAMRKLGLLRDVDLALHLPLRYEDETQVVAIASLGEGQTAQVEGVVRQCRVETRPRRQLVVHLRDDSGELVLRFLHFYPSHHKQMAAGQRLRVRGEVRGGFLGREMVHPAVKPVSGDAPLPEALTPVYPSSAQLPQAYLRKAVLSALARAPLAELLPPGIVPPGLPSLREALQFLHHPPPQAPLAALEDRSHPAWLRLKFDELLAQQLSQLHAQQLRAQLEAPALARRGDGLRERLAAALPFALTAAQARVCSEIEADLARAQPMHRLLQGDVGSGKTVVAALAAAVAIDAGWQCALMAPTEILAEQHFRKLVQWLAPLEVTVAWLSGSRKGRARARMIEQLASGEAALAVGTHAVIQDDVAFARLGLAIVDEQHRFGVAQRLALRDKLQAQVPDPALQAQRAVGGQVPDPALPGRSAAPWGDRQAQRAVGGQVPDPALPGRSAAPWGDRQAQRAVGGQVPDPALPGRNAPPWGDRQAQRAAGGQVPLEPHLLMMTATPIPRTLAMTYFADLDVSTIDQLPPGRTPVVTKVFAEGRREQVVARIRDEVSRGRQVYWVCPLVEESEHLDLQNATATHAELTQALPGVMVGLLHGRMPAAEKAAVMSLFTGGQMQVLVATTVIEVGVDVPSASLMVIEHAERFGLAQLHQLRGRVGRGAAASVCVLLYSPPLSPTARDRLKAMAETTDGFEIARRDLEIRGPGEFLGARQSGDALLRFADLGADDALLQHARRVAPLLWAEHPDAAAAHVQRWLAGKAEFMKA